MVECNKVNVELSDSQLNMLKSAVKSQTGVTLTLFRMGGGGGKKPLILCFQAKL